MVNAIAAGVARDRLSMKFAKRARSALSASASIPPAATVVFEGLDGVARLHLGADGDAGCEASGNARERQRGGSGLGRQPEQPKVRDPRIKISAGRRRCPGLRQYLNDKPL